MITLTRSLQEHLASSAAMHTRLCPRQVIGVRMARFACMYLGIDPALRRKQVFVYMEIRRCAADGVTAVTGASPTNQLMELVDYGKVAATFVSLQSGQAIRVSEHPTCRETATAMLPANYSAWEAQLQAYQIMQDHLLLRWQPVKVALPHIPEKHAVTCHRCHDRINEHCEVIVDNQLLCKACAYGSYYQSLDLQVSFRRASSFAEQPNPPGY